MIGEMIMNDYVSVNDIVLPLPNDGITQSLGKLDSKTTLILGGMVCATAVLCVGFTCLSGGNISISNSGLHVTHSASTQAEVA